MGFFNCLQTIRFQLLLWYFLHNRDVFPQTNKSARVSPIFIKNNGHAIGMWELCSWESSPSWSALREDMDLLAKMIARKNFLQKKVSIRIFRILYSDTCLRKKLNRNFLNRFLRCWVLNKLIFLKQNKK